MPRSKAESRAAGLKAANTVKRKHRTMQIAGKKAAETCKKNKLHEVKVEIGNRSASKQKENILAVSNFLVKLKKSNSSLNACVVCHESMENTLDKHHIDGNRNNNDPKNLVTICASCHRILDKAKTPEVALLDFRKRNKNRQIVKTRKRKITRLIS